MGNAAGSAAGSPLGGQEAETEEEPLSFRAGIGSLEQLARKFQVSVLEVKVLCGRFEQLGPDENGYVHRSVFQKPPYSTDPFCRQIWRRLTGLSHSPDLISFHTFLRTMVWWEKSPPNYKLEMFFSWMMEVDAITPETLSRILFHAFPEYNADEHRQMAAQIITAMSSNEGATSIDASDFISWFGRVPVEKLKEALDFRVLHVTPQTT